MMNFLERVLRTPRVVLTVMVALLIAGGVAYATLPRESFPAIDIPYFYISVSDSGVSPADAERLLGKPIEEKIKDIDGLTHYTTTATQGFSSVLLEFDVNTNKDKAEAGVRAALLLLRRAQFAPHLPGDPQQQDAAGEQQADDRQEPHGNESEADAHRRRGDDADHDHAPPPLRRQAGRGQADDHRVVAGQHQVDHDDLEEGGDAGLGENLVHGGWLASPARFDTRRVRP